jgi:hypothetical protein
MKRSVTTTEPAAAETTRRTTTCTRRRRGHETLIGSTSSFLIPPSYLKAAPAQYNEIPSARFALFIDLSRYSTINNAYSRNSENAAPIAQYNEMAPASAFPPLPLRASVGNPPVGLNPQASSHLKQGCASPGKATQASKEKTSASLACKASFLCPMVTPQPFARKTLALLRFVARDCALLLIIARNPSTRLGIAFPRELTRWHSARTLTQADRRLAQIFLSYEANFLSQSDRIRPNLRQRLFRQSFRPNPTYGQVTRSARVAQLLGCGRPGRRNVIWSNDAELAKPFLPVSCFCRSIKKPESKSHAIAQIALALNIKPLSLPKFYAGLCCK